MHLSIQMKVRSEKDRVCQLSSQAGNTVFSKLNPIKISRNKFNL